MTDQEFNHDALVGKTNTLLKDCPRSKKISDEALQVVERTNELLDESNRLKDQWYESKDSIESAKQMRITAQGYIDSMGATQNALSNCVIELFNMTRPPEVELAKIKGLV
jgi:predicted nuclease with TOPRIM domain